MSTFKTPIVRIRAIEPIPGADAIELAVIGDYRSVVRKGQFRQGDLAVYLPEASVLPEWLLRHLGMWQDEMVDEMDADGNKVPEAGPDGVPVLGADGAPVWQRRPAPLLDAEGAPVLGSDGTPLSRGKGRLAGGAGNRIKAVRLRGALSQGILMEIEWRGTLDAASVGVDGPKGFIEFGYGDPSWGDVVSEGDDVSERLGVTKWEPVIPACMAGEVCAIGGFTLKYDIENLKAYPDVLVPGELVAATEKLHGTNFQAGFLPGLGHPELFWEGDVFVASKGLGAQGLVFKDGPANEGNLYVRALVDIIGEATARRALALAEPHGGLYLLAEVFGPGIQGDFTYGLKAVEIRAFDVYLGRAGQGRWLGFAEKRALLAELGVPMVDVLYEGPYDRAAIATVRDGRTVTGRGACIREGVVVTPVVERRDPAIGRVILKDVSEAYLMRKGNATEYN